MFASRVTISKETKENMEKELTLAEKGEPRWKRLKEFEKDGRLSLVKTRRELAVAAGYDEDDIRKGVAWVFRLIKGGHITETLLSFNKKTKTPEYEYHLTKSEPIYRKGRPKKHPEEDVKREWKRWQDKVAAGQIPQSPVLDEVPTQTTVMAVSKMEITKGGINIKLELCDSNQVLELVKQLLKGEVK